VLHELTSLWVHAYSTKQQRISLLVSFSAGRTACAGVYKLVRTSCCLPCNAHKLVNVAIRSFCMDRAYKLVRTIISCSKACRSHLYSLYAAHKLVHSSCFAAERGRTSLYVLAQLCCGHLSPELYKLVLVLCFAPAAAAVPQACEPQLVVSSSPLLRRLHKLVRLQQQLGHLRAAEHNLQQC
jgi:hypothetical protein